MSGGRPGWPALAGRCGLWRLVHRAAAAGAGRGADPRPATFWLAGRDGDFDYLQREAGAASERQYAFTLQPRQFPGDFELMCGYQQTAPESHFTQHRLCSLATPTGRITLSDRRWIVTEHGARQETAIDDAEFERLLRTRFCIVWRPRP
jgi:N-hydroxyarylamine O-acetyltransferase